MRRPVARLVIESSEAFVAMLCTLSSLAYIGGAPKPRSVDELLPSWLRTVWGLYLLIGGVMTLAGLIIGRRRTEKVGLILLAGSATAYAAAVIATAGALGIFPAGVTLAFALAFAVRASDRVQRAAIRALRGGNG